MNQDTNPQDSTVGMSDEEFLNQWEALNQPTNVEEEEQEEPAQKATETPQEPEQEEPEQETSPEEEEPEEEEQTPDYEKAYKEIFGQPIRANGKEIQLNNAQEAVALIQMGANYNKKMQELKSIRPYVTMLQKAGLLDEGKLSYLIDLSQKKTEAVAKLIQDSSIDLYDFDVESQAQAYKPVNYMPDMSQVELDETLKELAAEDRDTYSKTMGILGTWDNASATTLMQDPSIIRTLNAQMKTGLFNTVWNEVERQRTLGGLVGVNDFQAYRQVGDAMFGQPQERPVVKNQVQNDQAKKKVAAARKQPATPTAQTISNSEFWNMSDEEFLKSANLPY